MSEHGETCQQVFPKIVDDLKCLVPSPTQRRSIYCLRGGKEPANITLKKLESEKPIVVDLFKS